MLFIRTALIVGAGIMLLPTDEAGQARFLETASSAVTRVSTTCERHPYICEKAGATWALFKQKAEFGGKLALDLVKERAFGQAPEKAHPVQPTSMTPAQRGTLTSKDMEPAWRGKVQRTGA